MEVGKAVEMFLYSNFSNPSVSSICVKEDDIVVSAHIKEFGVWEEENVEIALKAMHFYPDAVFIGEVNLETNVPNNPILYQMLDPILGCTPS